MDFDLSSNEVRGQEKHLASAALHLAQAKLCLLRGGRVSDVPQRRAIRTAASLLQEAIELLEAGTAVRVPRLGLSTSELAEVR